MLQFANSSPENLYFVVVQLTQHTKSVNGSNNKQANNLALALLFAFVVCCKIDGEQRREEKRRVLL